MIQLGLILTLSRDSVVDFIVVTTVLVLNSLADRNTKTAATTMEADTITPQM